MPGGAIREYWNPTGSGASMQLGSMSAGYELVKTECNFLTGMSKNNGGHGAMPLVFAPDWGGETYDVTMGRELGPNMPFTYINLGVHSQVGQGNLTRETTLTADGRYVDTVIPFQDSPFNAFNLLFGAGGGDGATSNSKTDILSAHAAAAQAIRSKLASYEASRLDQHLDAISDTQRRLDSLANARSFAIPHST